MSSSLPSNSAQHHALVERLNRGVSKYHRWTNLSPQPFGESLCLHRFRLGNGLEVRIVPDDSAPVLSYHTWYRVGSRHEQPGKTGLAHLFEHLMFNETRRLPYGQFDRMIEAAGGETNASTWTDFTQYHAELPASELSLIVDLEAQRMSELLLRKAQVTSEIEVVANERRYRVDDDVEGQAAELLYATAFRKHPYHHPTIGSMEDILNFTTADCSAFYRAYYAPNNAVVVIVGDVELEHTLKLLQKHYGRIAPGKLPPPPRVREPKQRNERVHVLHRPTPAAKLLLGYHAPAIGDEDFTVLTLISDLLFGGRGSRLFRELVREKELVSDLSGSVAPFCEPGLFELWFSLRVGVKPSAVRGRVDAAIKRLQREAVSQEELSRTANRYELGFLQSLESAAGKADQIGFHEAILGDASLMFTRIATYREITAAQVMDVAQRYLNSTSRTRIEIMPSGATA